MTVIPRMMSNTFPEYTVIQQMRSIAGWPRNGDGRDDGQKIIGKRGNTVLCNQCSSSGGVGCVVALCSRGRRHLIRAAVLSAHANLCLSVRRHTRMTPSPRTKSISIFRFATLIELWSFHHVKYMPEICSHSQWCDFLGHPPMGPRS